MSVLPDHRIRDWGAAGMICPFDFERVQPASYDCGLGNEFIVFDSHNQLYIDLADVQDRGARKVAADAVGRFVLHPGQFVLAATQERVKIPETLVARIEGKSSIGRLGVMVHVTAGYIDPGFCGNVTLEMTNLRNVPIILRVGKPICQISFHEMTEKPEQPYQGRYQDADGVEASLYGKQRKPPHTHEVATGGYIGPVSGDAAPFTPMREAFTCVPHGIYHCPTCLAAQPPRGSDPEVI